MHASNVHEEPQVPHKYCDQQLEFVKPDRDALRAAGVFPILVQILSVRVLVYCF
jgi:hypothetical protein